MSIEPLPPSVIAQIKSSIAITSLNGVVVELVKNSLDASSTKLDISVDYARGGCILEDDGFGILPSEFAEHGVLGKLYHSSKCNIQTPVHGGYGTFIASLSAMSLLSITSRHHQYRSHNMITIHRSEVLTRCTPAPVQFHLQKFNHGTRVTVRDLFGSMPVRLKQRAIVAERQRGRCKEWEALKREILVLVLSWPRNIAVTAREIEAGHKMIIRAPLPSALTGSSAGQFDTYRVCSILAQASVLTREEKDSWIPVVASNSNFEISGTISLTPCATKHVQFISFGVQPLTAADGRGILHETISHLFLNSAFGNEELEEFHDVEKKKTAQDGRFMTGIYTNKELKGLRKGPDRWPMFYINIQPSETRRLEVDDLLDDTGNSLSVILELLRAMVLEFLSRNHFRPNTGRSKARHAEALRTNPLGKADGSLPYRLVTKAHISTAKEPPSVGRTLSDPLGVNVKLPSFRHGSSRQDSPFQTSSRIKSGRTSSERSTREYDLVSSISKAPELNRASTASPAAEVVPWAPPDIIRESNARFTSKSGGIVRRPFEDVFAGSNVSRPKTSEDISKLPVFKCSDLDGTMRWVNPISKVETFINKRTGHTLQFDKIANSPARSHTSAASTVALHTYPKLGPVALSTTSQLSPWLQNIVKTWDNPIFHPTEPRIPQIFFDGPDADTQPVVHGGRDYCSHTDIERVFKQSATTLQARISRQDLYNAEVISQVDKKFVLVKLHSESEGEMLVMIDQHAADERIRIEALMADLCTPPSPTTAPGSCVNCAYLEKPLNFEISNQEATLFATYRSHFSDWGILYVLTELKRNSKESHENKRRITIRTLPPSITERCRLDPKILIDLLRTEVWTIHDNPSPPTQQPVSSTLSPASNSDEGVAAWITKIHTCPQGILDLLNSRACRSAIMFNDELTKEQCEVLVKNLAACVMPWSCAHGRVSLVPVVALGSLRQEQRECCGDGKGEWKECFAKEFRRWKRGKERLEVSDD